MIVGLDVAAWMASAIIRGICYLFRSIRSNISQTLHCSRQVVMLAEDYLGFRSEISRLTRLSRDDDYQVTWPTTRTLALSAMVGIIAN
jgi:hypothetical protein